MTLALQGAIAIKDATARERVKTRLWSAVAGFAAIAVVSLLSAATLPRDLLFLAVAFAAVLARRWGGRWNAVGMFAFMAYFIAAYFRPAPGDLPAIALALALCVLIAHGVRERILPDHPARDLRRAARSVDRRVGEAAAALRKGLRENWRDEGRQEVLLLDQRVRDALLQVQSLLPASETGGGVSPPSLATQASIQFFDLHLALETAIGAAFEGGEAEGEAFRASLDRLARLRREVRQTLDGVTDAMLVPGGPASAPTAPIHWTTMHRDPAVRSALQVTLACAIAMGGGYLLSEQRWFWAVLTAFLVFTNTQSRGDALLRGVHRSLGTAIGVGVGIGLATLLQGSLVLSLPLVAACVFLGFYLLQQSYGALTFFVTVALSLIYGLLGSFTPELLVLRLEETLIGASAGMFVAFFVFPRSTADAVGAAMDGFLAELDRLMVLADEEREGAASNWRLVSVTRTLDRRHGAIADAIRPLANGWLADGRREARLGLLRFTVLGYWAHRLAGDTAETARDPGLGEAIELCRAEIAAARKAPDGFFRRAEAAGLALPEAPAEGRDGARSDELLALHAIRHILAQTRPTDPGSTALPRSDKEPAVPGPARA